MHSTRMIDRWSRKCVDPFDASPETNGEISSSESDLSSPFCSASCDLIIISTHNEGMELSFFPSPTPLTTRTDLSHQRFMFTKTLLVTDPMSDMSSRSDYSLCDNNRFIYDLPCNNQSIFSSLRSHLSVKYYSYCDSKWSQLDCLPGRCMRRENQGIVQKKTKRIEIYIRSPSHVSVYYKNELNNNACHPKTDFAVFKAKASQTRSY